MRHIKPKFKTTLTKSVKANKKQVSADSEKALEEQQTEDEARVGSIRKEFAEHPSKGLTPAKLHSILEAAERGDLRAQHELFTDMEEKDTQISADLGKRRQLAAELEWQIVAPDNATPQEKAAAEFCNEVFSSLEVEDLIIDLGSAIGHGWINLELEWYQKDGKHLIKQPTARPHSWFQLDPEEQNTLTLRNSTHSGAELWNLGWVQHRHRAKAGYIARSGLHRVLVWPYLFQNYAIGDLAELLEIYGIPARLGYYPRNATDKEKSTLLRAVTTLGHSAAGIIPDGMKIDFLQAADGKSEMFEAMINWCERAKAKAILGGTLTSGTGEGTNTNALGNVHERSQRSLIKSDVRQYASTIRKDILLPLVLLNFGIDDINRTPRFYLDMTEPEDYKSLAETLPIFAEGGVEIPMWWVHEKTGIPKAEGNEPVFKSANQITAAALRAKTTQPGIAVLKQQPNAEAGPYDEIITELQEGVIDHLKVWIDSIAKMADEADSLEELQARLLDAYADLPIEQLTDVMSLAFSIAAATGIDNVNSEVSSMLLKDAASTTNE
ncbi:MAG: DUF935 domain-containing protein [Oleispira sp.]|nr:DUF935 domain-containing protein [Oleispira sp.]